jgi:thiamine biosynthesis protein ThiS
VNVVVNGKSLELESSATVQRLLGELGLEGPYALVERNGEPVERERYGETALQEGDRLVVARPVAGG